MKREITLSKILMLVAVVFMVETVVMLALFWLEADFPWLFQYRIVEALADSVLLSFLIAPFIYKWLVHPMQVSNSMKSRFLDMVSDQLRNPLNALQGLDTVGQHNPDDTLHKARSTALRMMQLRIDHIVAFSALQANEPLACNDITTLAQLGTEAHRRIAFIFEASGTGFENAVGNPDAPLGNTDVETLIQIVLSMLEIAMITPGSRKVILRTEILRQSKRATRARIIVSHDGNERALDMAPNSRDSIDLARDIAAHMARQTGARLRVERGRKLVLEITLPTTAAPS